MDNVTSAEFTGSLYYTTYFGGESIGGTTSSFSSNWSASFSQTAMSFSLNNWIPTYDPDTGNSTNGGINWNGSSPAFNAVEFHVFDSVADGYGTVQAPVTGTFAGLSLGNFGLNDTMANGVTGIYNTRILFANLPSSGSGGGTYSFYPTGSCSGDISFILTAGVAVGPGITPPGAPGGPVGPPVLCSLVCGPCNTWQCPTQDNTSNPINYSTGEIIHGPVDIADPAGGYLTLRRSYDNLCSSDYDGPSGWNWFTDRVPYVLQLTSGSNTNVCVMAAPGSSIYFTLSGGNYVPQFPIHGKKQTLAHDATAHTFTYQEIGSDGKAQTWVFNDCDQTTYTPGIFASYTDTYGVATTVTSYYNGTIGEMVRTTTTGGVTTYYSLLYNYNNNGGGVGDLKISQATLRHGTDGTNWTIDRQVIYTYYDGTTANGSLNDLQSVTVQDPAGNSFDKTYYRYWTPTSVTALSATLSGATYTATATTGTGHNLSVGGTVTVSGASDPAFNGTFTVASVPTSTSFTYALSATPTNTSPTGTVTAIDATTGFPHGLKYIVGPASYARLLTAVGDPTTATITDATLAPYADNYFEYDGRVTTSGSTNQFFRSVTKEIAQGTSCSCSGMSGQGTFAYSRSVNTNSGYSDGYNTWKFKTVETLPDGNTNTVYGNYARGTILKVFTDTTTGNRWGTYYQRNAHGLITLEAQPSAVSIPSSLGTLEQYNDLLHSVSGNYQYLNDSTGLIKIHDYDTDLVPTATSTTAGDVPDYLRTEKVQQGETGTPITVSSYTYIAHTADLVTPGDGGGGTIYPMAVQTDYHNIDGTGGQATSYAYTWYSNGGLATTSVNSKTTTKAVISSTQNGPAVADSMVEVYDVLGHLQWTKDADGFITYTQTDGPTGSTIKQIADVDTTKTSDFNNLPSGWSTPSGGGLHLVTVMTVDGLGRTTMTTDPVGYITYMVYNDVNHEVRTYPGWQASSSSTTGPIQVSREHRPAVSPSSDQPYNETLTTSATPATTSGVPNGTEAISASNIQTLSRNYLDQSNRVVRSDSYFSLAGMTYYANGVSGNYGTQNTNYYETVTGYDEMGRKARSVNAVGTISRTVYDNEGRVSAAWVGTSDTGWSDTSGGGNMTKLRLSVYDGGGVGDGTLTQVTQYPDTTSTHARVSQMVYDWRDRLVASKSGVQSTEDTTTHRPITYCVLDNLGRCTSRFQYDGDTIALSLTAPSASLLRKRMDTSFDDQNRPYQTKTFDVNQSNGTDGVTGSSTLSSGLVTNTFYNHRGSVIESVPPGAPVMKKTYDGVGRMVKQYVTDGSAGTTWAAAGTVTGDNVLQQMQQTYDADGNVVLTTSKQRFNDTTTTGELGNSTSSPKAWVSYTAYYFDQANRRVAEIQYGRDASVTAPLPVGGVPPDVPNFLGDPSPLSTTLSYNSAGWAYLVTDPRGLKTAKTFDLMGRVTQQVEAWDGTTSLPLSASSVGAASNRATNTVYDGLSHTYQLTALMPTGSNSQTTQYNYGVGSSGQLYSDDLLASVQYPSRTAGTPGTTVADKQTYTYNYLGESLTFVDQNQTTHSYTYDVLARRTIDSVAVYSGNPQGVDQTVLSQTISFDTGGRPYQLTCYGSSGGTGTIINQIQMAYNGLGQLTAEYQSHSGAVNTSTSPKTQYAYVEMASGANNSRLTGTTYPNSRVVYTSYNDAGDTAGVSAAISRVTAICSSSTRGTSDANVIAAYTYLGLSSPVRKDYPVPKVRLDLWGGTTGTYAGLDQYQRTISQDWVNYNSTPFDVFKLNHAYDRDSNRLYAQNTTQGGASQVYQYDNLNRLTQYTAGSFNATNNTIQSYWTRTGQQWTLDTLGNPTAINQWDNGTGGFLGWRQGTFNSVNEQTGTQVRANAAKSPITDSFSSNTGANWVKPGSGDAFNVNSTNAGNLTVTTVARDTVSSVQEDASQAVLLHGEQTGPVYVTANGTIPSGTSSGQQGIIFGYKSWNDYWLQVLDLSNTQKVYHVVNGAKTQVSSASWSNGAGSSQFLYQAASRRYLFSGAGYSFGTSGTPSGRLGLFSTVASTKFGPFSVYEDSSSRDMAGRWINWQPNLDAVNAVNPSTSRYQFSSNAYGNYHPSMLKNLRLNKFQAVFSVKRESGATSNQLSFAFNGSDQDNLDFLNISHSNTAAAPAGQLVVDGAAGTSVTGTQTVGNVPALGASDILWVQVTNTGSTVTVKEIKNNTGTPTSSDWSSASNCYSSTGFRTIGGMIGFKTGGSSVSVDNLSVNSYNSATSAFDITEAQDNFVVDSNSAHSTYGMAADTLTSDSNGNQTYDGTQVYVYDGWNRLKTVSHGYRDTSSVLHHGQSLDTMSYDARGRRIIKAVIGTGSWDCTYHYYMDKDSVIEEQNGSAQSIKQFVWGKSYIDELIQTALNSSPTTQTTCDTLYWTCQDANWNVLGMVNSSGVLRERYEYTPYGERQVYFSSGSNDVGCYAPIVGSQKFVAGSTAEPWGLCEVGHQGLMHDEECGLVYDRARYLAPGSTRFLQRDRKGYIDGKNLMQYELNDPIGLVDFRGTCGCRCGSDITDQLAKIASDIQNASRSLTNSQKKDLLEAASSLSGWDIRELAWKKSSFSKAGNGIGDGKNTVTVAGHCYPAEEVNYFLWGLITAAATEGSEQGRDNFPITLYDEISISDLYRYTVGQIVGATLGGDGDYSGVGPNVEGRDAWITAGYYSFTLMGGFKQALAAGNTLGSEVAKNCALGSSNTKALNWHIGDPATPVLAGNAPGH